ncbi:hypothetical protein, partial [Chroococcidiopsis sp. TS-821]|uniref:hypothetical protein n=1 Tax=Chroococcidiopsis sp. TS-821 TaxID=1378066 RepID=UPI000D46AE0E
VAIVVAELGPMPSGSNRSTPVLVLYKKLALLPKGVGLAPLTTTPVSAAVVLSLTPRTKPLPKPVLENVKRSSKLKSVMMSPPSFASL